MAHVEGTRLQVNEVAEESSSESNARSCAKKCYSMSSLRESLWVMTGMLVLCAVILLPTLFGRSEQVSTTSFPSWRQAWVVRLFFNLLGYATVGIPIFLGVQYLKRIDYDRRAGQGLLARFIRACVFGQGSPGEVESVEVSSGSHPTSGGLFNPARGSVGHFALLAFCFAGLQASFLSWGLLQERIITRDYDGERFHDSQFLVFINRALAGIVAAFILLFLHQPPHRAPVYQYAYSSLSNILSSWFQYEALKYVSFPTQVLAKASKIIPVMLMGKIVNRRSFELVEYITAAMISAGVAIFLLSNSTSKHPVVAVTTFSGVFLLIGYMMFDSFTSNWQDSLFKRYHMSPLQMMIGTNIWSCLLTFTSLMEQGSLTTSLAFVARHWRFSYDVLLLSVCSAIGQLFIYFTIARFGAVTFIIIMTVRQGLAILLSCLVYSHPVTLVGVCGILIVFLALFVRIYFNSQKRKRESVSVSEEQKQPPLVDVRVDNGNAISR